MKNIKLIHEYKSKLWFECNVDLLFEDSSLIVIRINSNSKIKRAFTDGRVAKFSDEYWELKTDIWKDCSLTYVIPNGSFIAYGLLLDSSLNSKSYYLNYQYPINRTEHSLITCDLELDVIVNFPFDGSWSWKDKKEYYSLINSGYFEKDIIPCEYLDIRKALETLSQYIHRLDFYSKY